MLRTLMWGAVVASMLTGVALGDVLWINPGDPNYMSMTKDAKLRGDSLQDWNLGAASGASNRFYATYDVNGAPTNRTTNFVQWFDVSSIPTGSVINHADLWIYMGYGNTGSDFEDVKLSRLQPGKGWLEYVIGGDGPHNDGSVTWYHQAAQTIPWATPGATGAADIDLATTKSFGWTHSGDWIMLDITNWVQAWVNGTWENTGMVYWGGKVINTDPAKYFMFNTKEDANKPELYIDYVPEPATLMLLGLGLVGLLRRR